MFKTKIKLLFFIGQKFSDGKTTCCGEREIIEILDFECLEKRMPKLNLNPTIVNLLKAIECSWNSIYFLKTKIKFKCIFD